VNTVAWALVAAALIGVTAFAVGATVRYRRARARAVTLWRGEGPRVLEEATTTTVLLEAAAQGTTRLALVAEAVRRVGARLDRLAEQGPDDGATAAAAGLSVRLRTVLGDVEADVVRRGSGPEPTASVRPSREPDRELGDALDGFRRQIDQLSRPTAT
jgi:hypothetical protein